jgi:hypothetical protein
MRLFRALITISLSLGASTSVMAQVGHNPASSPYRDIRVGHTVTILGGELSGGRGKAQVGPSGGFLGGIRYDAHVGGAATIFLGTAFSTATRNLIDPDTSLNARNIGVAEQSLLMVEGGFNFVLTGRKTWNRIAPYGGASLGMVIGSSVPEDSTGFRFGNKFMVTPLVGIRFFPTRKFHLRIEARDILWRLNYNNTRFFDIPVNDPLAPPVLDAVTTKSTEWVHHPVIRIGIGWTIR